jgi:hypothetical protein
MHDGIELEKRGRPTTVVVTTEFLREAEAQRAALGMEGLVPSVIQHPLSTLTPPDIAMRAADAASQAIRIWLGR